MKRNSTNYVSLGEYVHQALLSATYENDISAKQTCVVGEVPLLQGCYTQGENFEEARENLREAIELWITIALQQNETLPVINGCTLIQTLHHSTTQRRNILVRHNKTVIA
ncbi:MAG: type II toxin-antitoxin system HicB family antitoxin [Ignavibacteriales bacterium]|nr:type II toxin-antitoxin system HicB family antitoxin [Ignavibacteriales bacterium]